MKMKARRQVVGEDTPPLLEWVSISVSVTGFLISRVQLVYGLLLICAFPSPGLVYVCQTLPLRHQPVVEVMTLERAVNWSVVYQTPPGWNFAQCHSFGREGQRSWHVQKTACAKKTSAELTLIRKASQTVGQVLVRQVMVR